MEEEASNHFCYHYILVPRLLCRCTIKSNKQRCPMTPLNKNPLLVSINNSVLQQEYWEDLGAGSKYMYISYHTLFIAVVTKSHTPLRSKVAATAGDSHQSVLLKWCLPGAICHARSSIIFCCAAPAMYDLSTRGTVGIAPYTLNPM